MKRAEWEAQKRMKEEALAEVKRLRKVIKVIGKALEKVIE